MIQSSRSCKYVNADNCSVVRIIDNEPTIYGIRLYVTTDYSDSKIDWSNDRVYFYIRERGGTQSLNQSADSSSRGLEVPLNIAFEIFQAFKEIDENNAKILQSMQTK